MKTLRLLIIAAALGCALPVTSYAAPASAVAQENGAAVQISYMSSMLHTINTLSALMENLKTRSDADAAAPAVQNLLQSVVHLTKAADALGEPSSVSAAETAQITKLMEDLKAAQTRYLNAMNGLPVGCMMSEKFTNALKSGAEE